ncbi:unnamed protein product [Closterium sp. NIES-53]
MGQVKRRILMGTYALSAGYYDAYYKKAQQVRTMIRREFLAALEGHDALITPTAPTTAYRIGEKTSDPLAMYVGDLMTVSPLKILPYFSQTSPRPLPELSQSSPILLPDFTYTFSNFSLRLIL